MAPISHTTGSTKRALGNILAVDVAVVDGSGNQITSFSASGTQYTEGDVDSSITGQAFLWEDTGDTLRTVSATTPLPVTVPKTILTKTGAASATFTIVAAVASKRIKVIGLSLITSSTTAVTITFKDGAAGTALATYPMQAISGTNFGVVENVPIPSFLFGTSAATLLEMSFSGAISVTYNLRYHSDDSA